MTAKPNTEVIPTAADHLRAAFAKREELASVVSLIQEKIAKLAPFEADVADSRAELQKVAESDAQALQAWIDNGGKGTPPAGDVSARESAARKLASAEARLRTAEGVSSNLQNEWISANEAVRAFVPMLHIAQIDVLGEEALRAVEVMRKTSLDVLEAEAYFLQVRQSLQDIRAAMDSADVNGNTTAGARRFSEWLSRIADNNKLSLGERQQADEAGSLKAQRAIEQLLAGEDPEG